MPILATVDATTGTTTYKVISQIDTLRHVNATPHRELAEAEVQLGWAVHAQKTYRLVRELAALFEHYANHAEDPDIEAVIAGRFTDLDNAMFQLTGEGPLSMLADCDGSTGYATIDGKETGLDPDDMVRVARQRRTLIEARTLEIDNDAKRRAQISAMSPDELATTRAFLEMLAKPTEGSKLVMHAAKVASHGIGKPKRKVTPKTSRKVARPTVANRTARKAVRK